MGLDSEDGSMCTQSRRALVEKRYSCPAKAFFLFMFYFELGLVWARMEVCAHKVD
jgi:hypothetical protein